MNAAPRERVASRQPSAVALATLLAALAILETACGNVHAADSALRTQGTESASWDGLNLPEPFRQLIRDRAAIDRYQAKHHRIETNVPPPAGVLQAARNRNPAYLRTLRAPEALSEPRRALLTAVRTPLRGYRAAILGRSDDAAPSQIPESGLGERDRTAARRIADRLAHDGLIVTLAHVAVTLGPEGFLTNATATLTTLETLGFPWDLLACFSDNEAAPPSNGASAVVRRVARMLGEGATPEGIGAEFSKVPFRFRRAHPGFQVATEDGEHELGLLRMQAGGGWQGGIIPGGGLDAINQIVAAAAGSDFLISVPDEVAGPFVEMARQSWRLRRTNQVTVVIGPAPVAAWAQDNGKAGIIHGASGRPGLATLAPRFACIGEGESAFEPGESFLMDGLQAAGHEVAHSSLLFQGGNLLAARDPKNGGRVLFVGQGEVYRNMALGLTRAQTVAAFREESGVDRVVVVPGVSYHLDFDVSLRAGTNGLTVFVNDTMAAVRLILETGLGALERHGSLAPVAAAKARAALAAGRDKEAVAVLSRTVQGARGPRAEFPAALALRFVADRFDSASLNLQCFLLALDVLEASTLEGGEPAADNERAGYLRALQRMEAARRNQEAELARNGWRIHRIPSMPDLFRSINYLNGIQHREGWLMPAFQGFYAALDQAAVAAFQGAPGPKLRITPIRTTACQGQHGGVHCVAAAYPKLPQDREGAGVPEGR